MNNENTLFIYKYRPIFLTDYGMDNDTFSLLKMLIQSDNLNILLIGDVASGKTSILNTIAKEYYHGYSYSHYEENILHINNLKEQGINYYRTEVKTFCQTSSVIKGKKKFIVLDDIDLINEQSQQVFRNCIDKYSHNVQFISSCNNLQKVIDNLQSRFISIKLKPIQKEQIINIFNKIRYNEHIDIHEDAAEFIVNISNNVVKVLINYMEKFKLLNEKITLQIANKLCSNISFYIFEEYTLFLKQKNIYKAIDILYGIYDKGYSVIDILDNYFIFVKNTNMLSEDDKYTIIPYICKYITIFNNIHEDEIELSLFTNNLINNLSIS